SACDSPRPGGGGLDQSCPCCDGRACGSGADRPGALASWAGPLDSGRPLDDALTCSPLGAHSYQALHARFLVDTGSRCVIQRTPFVLLPFFASDYMRVRSWWWSRSWLIEVALVTAMAASCPQPASAQSLLDSSLDSYRLAAVPEPPAPPPPPVPSPPV